MHTQRPLMKYECIRNANWASKMRNKRISYACSGSRSNQQLCGALKTVSFHFFFRFSSVVSIVCSLSHFISIWHAYHWNLSTERLELYSRLLFLLSFALFMHKCSKFKCFFHVTFWFHLKFIVRIENNHSWRG